MATSALQPSRETARTRPVSLARVLALVPFLVVAVVSLVELELADRKFGLFSGGFGMSRAVDRPAEIALFALGYAAAQVLERHLARGDRARRRRTTACGGVAPFPATI